MSSNIKLEVRVEAIPVIPISHIAALTWNKEQGTTLQSLRNKLSREEIKERLLKKGITYSVQALYKLERGETESISPTLLVSILEIVGGSLESFYPMHYVDSRTIAKLKP